MAELGPISFRVTAHQRQILSDLADAFGVRSPDLAAQKIVIDYLGGDKDSPVDTRLNQVLSELAEARADLSVATEVLLVFAGKLNESAAREWVLENLKAR
jgi:hypothetical protein